MRRFSSFCSSNSLRFSSFSSSICLRFSSFSSSVYVFLNSLPPPSFFLPQVFDVFLLFLLLPSFFLLLTFILFLQTRAAFLLPIRILSLSAQAFPFPQQQFAADALDILPRNSSSYFRCNSFFLKCPFLVIVVGKQLNSSPGQAPNAARVIF